MTVFLGTDEGIFPSFSDAGEMGVCQEEVDVQFPDGLIDFPSIVFTVEHRLHCVFVGEEQVIPVLVDEYREVVSCSLEVFVGCLEGALPCRSCCRFHILRFFSLSSCCFGSFSSRCCYYAAFRRWH